MLSIIIPARNEEENLKNIFYYFKEAMNNLDYEIVFVNDFSTDNTMIKAKKLFGPHKNFKIYDNKKKGLGGAINLGIEKSNGSKIAIMMADLSDDINDLIIYNKLLDKENLDAVLGSRFMENSKVEGYPIKKLILNRIFNFVVSVFYWNKYNDYTNAFKKDTLKTLMPFVSESFNIFLEIPLKIIGRGYSYKVIKINWFGRKKGEAKFKIKELQSKYIFTLLYCLLERILLKIKK